MVKGEEGLPVEVKDGDQHREPADFIAFVKQAYANKPANYERMIKPRLRIMAIARKQRSFRSRWEADDSEDESDNMSQWEVSPRCKRKITSQHTANKRSHKSALAPEGIKEPNTESEPSTSETSTQVANIVAQASDREMQEIEQGGRTDEMTQVASAQPAADQEANQSMVDQLLQDIAYGTGMTYMDVESTEITLDSPLPIS